MLVAGVGCELYVGWLRCLDSLCGVHKKQGTADLCLASTPDFFLVRSGQIDINILPVPALSKTALVSNIHTLWAGCLTVVLLVTLCVSGSVNAYFPASSIVTLTCACSVGCALGFGPGSAWLCAAK